jgi:hypothetical protein
MKNLLLWIALLLISQQAVATSKELKLKADELCRSMAHDAKVFYSDTKLSNKEKLKRLKVVFKDDPEALKIVILTYTSNSPEHAYQTIYEHCKRGIKRDDREGLAPDYIPKTLPPKAAVKHWFTCEELDTCEETDRSCRIQANKARDMYIETPVRTGMTHSQILAKMIKPTSTELEVKLLTFIHTAESAEDVYQAVYEDCKEFIELKANGG